LPLHAKHLVRQTWNAADQPLKVDARGCQDGDVVAASDEVTHGRRDGAVAFDAGDDEHRRTPAEAARD